MKKSSFPVALLTLSCTAIVALSIFSASSARAGAASSDEIIIYRSTESIRAVDYFQAHLEKEYDEELEVFVNVSRPGGKRKYSQRNQCYVILNLTSGDYRKVSYRSGSYRDRRDGRRIRFKALESEDQDFTPMALFQTDPEERRNYMILSLQGSGKGLNFDYDDSDEIDTHVQSETLEGRVTVQRIRTDQGTMECLAPSSLRGESGEEHHSEQSGPTTFTTRDASQGNRTLRIDKRLIRAAKDSGATTLADFQAVVVDYLESRGYSDGS